MTTKSKKPCVNCTCATTGFCPRGVGANIPPELAAALWTRSEEWIA